MRIKKHFECFTNYFHYEQQEKKLLIQESSLSKMIAQTIALYERDVEEKMVTQKPSGKKFHSICSTRDGKQNVRDII